MKSPHLSTFENAEPVRILLDPEQSEILTDISAASFAVIGRASYPDDPKRWVIHLLPATIATANAAVKVARGELLTRKKNATRQEGV